MHSTPIPLVRNLLASSWALDAVKAVRDALVTLPADRLIDERERLSVSLSEAVGGLSARTLTDGGPDFEASAEWSLDDVWTLTDDDEPAPLELLATSMPPLSGGAPDYVPTAEDWASYRAFCDQLERKQRTAWMSQVNEGVDEDGPLSEADIQIATGSF